MCFPFSKNQSYVFLCKITVTDVATIKIFSPIKDVQVGHQISEGLIYFTYSTVIIHNNYASNMSFS